MAQPHMAQPQPMMMQQQVVHHQGASPQHLRNLARQTQYQQPTMMGGPSYGGHYGGHGGMMGGMAGAYMMGKMFDFD